MGAIRRGRGLSRANGIANHDVVLLPLIEVFEPDHDLPRTLEVEQGRAEAETVSEQGGRPRKDAPETLSVGKGLAGGGNSAGYLLRRLARHHADVLAAYERGEHASVRAAAIAAGIITPRTPLEDLRRAWRRASEAERDEFRKVMLAAV